jgi:hypothetical protein
MDFGVVYSTIDEDHFELTEKSPGCIHEPILKS